jgi:diguanylate cyclase (GGDEF)-like protein
MSTNSAARGEPGPVAGTGFEPLLVEVAEVAQLRARKRVALSHLDRLTAALLGGGFLGFAGACASEAKPPDLRTAVVTVALVVVYAVARRTEFVAPTGSTVPTEPVLVALLFSAGPALVPVLVLSGLLAVAPLRKSPVGSVQELLVRSASGWHCAGPVLVLWSSGALSPTTVRWPVLLLALLAQFAFDSAVALVRCHALGVALKRLASPLLFTFSVDAILAPLAFCTVVATRGSPAVVVFAALPVALLRLLATDRNQRLSTAVTLGRALESVRDEARVDPMTGLANRRAWEEAVAVAQEQAGPGSQSGLVTVVLMADIDHLKMVNDTFGHEAGDDLLRAFASTLAAVAPEGAVAARLGGDEFGVIFNVANDGGRAAHDLVARSKSAIAGCTIPCGERLSASMGAACCPPAPSVGEAMRMADAIARMDKGARRVQRASIADLSERRRAGRWPSSRPS